MSVLRCDKISYAIQDCYVSKYMIGESNPQPDDRTASDCHRSMIGEGNPQPDDRTASDCQRSMIGEGNPQPDDRKKT